MTSNGVLLDKASLDQGDLDFSQLQSTLAGWQLHEATSNEQVRERIATAEVVVSNKVLLDRAAIEQAQKLKLICIAATGTNNVDLDAARQCGVTVCNVRAYATPSVVQHVFALLLALSRHLPDYQMAVQRGDWQRSDQFCLLDYPIEELQDKLLGIVGYGELGRAVARAAECFGMQVLVAQRPGGAPDPGRLPLDELLARADIVSLHIPLAENTRNLIGTRELALMKPTALLINTARGGIVDEVALAAALRTGQIGGAAFDVLSSEPPGDNPLLDPSLANLIVTPHIAWASRAARQRLIDQVADNVRAFYNGRPQNVVA